MRARFLIMGLMLLMLAPMVQAEIYKWVDERGNVHYGERPHGAQAEELKIRNQPGKTRAADPQQRLEKQKRLLQGYERKRREDSKQREEADKKAAEKKQACSQTRDRLQAYEESQYLYRLDENGERQILTDAERAAETDRLRTDIKQYCN